MAEAWQTLEEAALTLGISSRTLARRLARGEFETRMENGRREVLVVIYQPDPSLERLAAAGRTRSAMADNVADTASVPPAEPFRASADDYGSTIDTAADEVQETMLALHEDRLRRTDLAIMAYQQSVNVAAAEARRAITRSRIAWGVAGGLTVMAFLGATWATHRVTNANAEVRHLSDNVRQLTDAVDAKIRETKDLQNDSQTAKVAAARAEGELAAAKSQIGQLIEAQRTAQARLSAQATTADTSASPATQASAAIAPVTQMSAAIAPVTQASAALAPTTQASATTQPHK